MRISKIFKINAYASAIASDPSWRSLPNAILIPFLSPKMRRYRPNHRKLERPPIIMFVVLILIPDPAPAPTFALDAVSNRTISANTVIFSFEAKAKEASVKRLRVTKGEEEIMDDLSFGGS